MNTNICKTVVRLRSRLNTLKRLAAVCGLLLLIPAAKAGFTWPVYEPFSEWPAPLNLGGNSTSNFWNFGQGNGGGVNTYVITSAAAMSYSALLPDPSNSIPGAANGVQEVPNNTTSADRGAWFPTQTGTIYASFLLNYQDNGGALADRCALTLVTGASSTTNAGSFSSVYTAVWLTPDYRLQLTKNYRNASANFSPATPVLSTNVPHLIVVRYLRVTGAPDEVDLWVDPTPFGDDTQIPPPTISTTNAPNIANFDGVLLSNRKLVNNTYYMNVFQVDELRIDSTWSGVTPLATPPPGPMFTVTGGGRSCPGTYLSVGLNGSVGANVYLLYTNSVYSGTSLAGTGAALDFGPQIVSAIYSVLASNITTAAVGWMSNSVSVAVTQPPNIVTEPLPVVTATNNRAEFAVHCTGDDLVYQWYRNDGNPLSDDTHLTGSTTPDLVIWPATAADIAGYYCVITNSCSDFANPNTFAVTTTNSLTLDAPNNLVYYGNSFASPPLAWPWDIATSSSWNTGGSVFNEGDNVTFDDTYNTSWGTVIPLAGTLTPTLVTYATSQQLTLTGTGTIAGSGGLLVTGSGRMVISNLLGAGVFAPNPYTGGTVISNGMVYIQSWDSSLGTGPITLAGGTLESKLKGNAGVGLSNTVFVTANSAWQTDQSGQQSAALMGALIGNPGTTLTLTNSTTATNGQNWIYLNAPFTNNSAIVLDDLQTNWFGFTGIRLLLNNSTGAQIYNGAISEGSAGVGGVAKIGSGAVYLNAANTYTTGTTNNAGLLAGSGSINSPLIVNSGGTLGGGSAGAIGTFSVNNNVFLNGSAYVRVDKSLAQSNDMIAATGFITNGGTGTVTITNIGTAPLAPGDRFRIFSGAVINGAGLSVAGGDVGWSNNLAIDGSVVAAVTIAGYPTNIGYTMNGNTLTINWPATHLGWILQSQTNSLGAGLQTNWFDIPSTGNSTSLPVTVNPTNPAVFYRLRHP